MRETFTPHNRKKSQGEGEVQETYDPQQTTTTTTTTIIIIPSTTTFY
jgi:hypothetical protein